jgi:hypothetical protein
MKRPSMRERLSYANVMATIAVFMALGGSSYAAIKITGKNVKDNSLTGADIKNNTVGTRDIQNNSVGGPDIRAEAVNSDDVENDSLLAQDFKPGQLPAGAQGPKGDTGAPGPQGPKGDTGTVDTSNFFDKAQSDARYLASSAKAADSDKLDGLDSTAFLGTTAKAADSDKLDGIDSSDFMRGPGRIETYFWPHLDDFGVTGGVTNLFFIGEAGISFRCRTNGTASFSVRWDKAFTWWYDTSFGVATEFPPGSGSFEQVFTLGVGNEAHTFRGLAGGKTMFVQLNSHIDGSGCSFAATSQGTQNNFQGGDV